MSLDALLLAGTQLQEVEADIYSVMDETERDHHYDRLAAGYDLIVGNSLYNRLLWGNWASDYRRFVTTAVNNGRGWYLDAGCGTLVFSAPVYQHSRRPMVLLDRSLGMLRRARRRLRKLCGSVPEHIHLLQGDLLELPFREQVFDTVASFGTLHLFDPLAPLIMELWRVREPGGSLYLSSLVRERGIGRHYYDLLVKSGEIARRRDSDELRKSFDALGYRSQFELAGNMCNIVVGGHNSSKPRL